MSHALIDAGYALANFARDIAAEARQASGDLMDGAYAEALAAAWDEAMTVGGHQEATADPPDLTGLLRLIADIRAAIGDPSGRLMQDELVAHCQALRTGRDELLHLARCLRSGFAVALAEATDPDTLTDEEEQSLDASRIHIAAANGACARLAQLEAEIEGQGRLL